MEQEYRIIVSERSLMHKAPVAHVGAEANSAIAGARKLGKLGNADGLRVPDLVPEVTHVQVYSNKRQKAVQGEGRHHHFEDLEAFMAISPKT